MVGISLTHQRFLEMAVERHLLSPYLFVFQSFHGTLFLSVEDAVRILLKSLDIFWAAQLSGVGYQAVLEVNLEDIHIRVLQDILQLQLQLVGLLDGFLYLTVHLVHVQVTVTCLCHVNGRDDIVEDLTLLIQQWADIIFYIGVFPVFIRLLHSVTSRCGILVVT